MTAPVTTPYKCVFVSFGVVENYEILIIIIIKVKILLDIIYNII